jgi:hypothetical protein
MECAAGETDNSFDSDEHDVVAEEGSSAPLTKQQKKMTLSLPGRAIVGQPSGELTNPGAGGYANNWH